MCCSHVSEKEEEEEEEKEEERPLSRVPLLSLPLRTPLADPPSERRTVAGHAGSARECSENQLH